MAAHGEGFSPNVCGAMDEDGDAPELQRKGICDLDLERSPRSDLLPHLVSSIQAFPSLRKLFPEILQLRVGIDANIVQSELQCRLKCRRKPGARYALDELLVCGILIEYAPHFLREEMYV